jgi:hypothetical protein
MYKNEEEGMKKVKRAKKTKKVKKTKRMKKAKRVLKKKKVMKPKKIKRVTKARKPKKAMKPKKVVKKAPPAPVPVEKVPYTQENATMCICTRCPVQTDSTCAREKIKLMEAMMAKGMPQGMMPPPADLPGLYCATGVATCKDLDLTRMCICAGCPVWEKCKLGDGTPRSYYCRDGKAL